MTNQTIKPTGCCEPFNPESWQGKEIIWQDKVFVKDHVTSFLHIPLNFGQKVVKNMKLIEAAGAKAPHQLMLTDENSLWGADIYIDVSKEVPDVEITVVEVVVPDVEVSETVVPEVESIVVDVVVPDVVV